MPISFDDLFIRILDIVKLRSKDPRTQVGCVLVSPDYRSITLGWNAMPSKIQETDERWNNRDIKHQLVIHAEESAILNARKDLTGWHVYISFPPCPSCTRLLIHAKVGQIIYKGDHPNNTKYNYDDSFALLKEAGISIRQYDGN